MGFECTHIFQHISSISICFKYTHITRFVFCADKTASKAIRFHRVDGGVDPGGTIILMFATGEDVYYRYRL